MDRNIFLKQDSARSKQSQYFNKISLEEMDSILEIRKRKIMNFDRKLPFKDIISQMSSAFL